MRSLSGLWRTLRLAAVLLLLIPACSHVKTTMKEQFQESLQGAPSKLDASPETSGLLLVDAEVVHKGLLFGQTRFGTTGAWIEGAAGKHIYAGSFGRGLVVFQGLEPGSYRLIKLNGSSGRSWIGAQMPPDSQLVAVLLAGTPTYLGRLTVTSKGFKNFALDWKREAAAERAAWQRLRREYRETPWAASIDARLQALQ